MVCLWEGICAVRLIGIGWYPTPFKVNDLLSTYNPLELILTLPFD